MISGSHELFTAYIRQGTDELMPLRAIFCFDLLSARVVDSLSLNDNISVRAHPALPYVPPAHHSLASSCPAD